MKRIVVILIFAGFTVSARCGQFTPEEQALVDKHLIIFVCLPNRHSGHKIGTFKGPNGNGPGLMFIFGMEDVETARRAGREMAEKGYKPDEAVKHLLMEARVKYHGNQFFERYFMNAASDAYNATK